MYWEPSRQTTGLLFITSLCIHIVLLCALLMSYHVHNLLVTQRRATIVPPYQTTAKPANIIFYPQKTGGTQPSITQSQGASQNQSANTATTSSQNTPASAIATPLATADTQLAPTQTTASTTTIAAPSATMPNASTPARATNSNLELPLSETDGIPTKQRTQAAQKITMQDIARGFLSSVQREQEARQSPQQATQNMVRDNYEMKVLRLFQKSVLVSSRPITMTRAISTIAEVVLTIDRTGAIVDFEFNHQLPKQDLIVVEKFLRNAAYSTGLYPSFPRTFVSDRHKISLPLQIQVTRGSHSYVITTNYRSI